LSKAIAVFDEKEPDVVVVFDDKGNYKGILSERWVYRSRLDPAKTKVKALTRSVPKASPDMPVVDVAKLMVESYVQAVPVFDNDKLVGVVGDIDLLFKVVEKSFGNLKALEFATTDLKILLPHETIGKALALFRDNNISRAPVVDHGKVVGMVTMHDIVTRFLIPREKARRGELRGEKIHTLSSSVKHIMSSPVVSVGVDGTIRGVVKLMKENEISGVMILDKDEKALGIVTKRDLLEALIKHAAVQKKEKFAVQFAGDHDDIDEFEMEHIRKDMQAFMEKVRKMFDEAILVVHFKKIKASRKDVRRYLIRARLITPGKTYAAHHEGFNAIDVMEIVKDKLERVLLADKERETDVRKSVEYLEKYEFWM
jgi:CBS domain-containing protein